MANTIAYTSTNSPTGSLKSGVISINLNNQIIGQNYNWRNGIVFSNQYIIYSDTYTQGIDTEANAKPCAWACDYNDTALLNLINSLPARIGQAQYGSLADAMTWLQGENKYFIVNQNYPTVTTNGIVFYVDAGLTGSYPVVGTSWYDVSGGGKKGTLVNGASFTNNGANSYIGLDGSDDRISTDFTQTFSSELTVECVYLGTKTSRNHLWTIGSTSNSTSITADLNDSGIGLWVYWNGGGSPAIRYLGNFTDGRVKHLVFTHNNTTNITYLNGSVLTPYDVLGTQSFSPPVGGVMEIGSINNTLVFGGNIYKYVVYNRELTQSEILQNYYLGPIVTDSIKFAVDPGNVISYPGTGSVLYDMSTNQNNGTITNGPAYSINQGGIFSFDGADDYVTFGNPSSLVFTSNVSMSLWIKGDINSQNPSANIYPFAKEDAYGIKVSSGTSPGAGMIVRIGGNYSTCAGSNVLDGKWNNIVVTYDGQGLRSYVNGVLDSQNLSVSGNLDAGGGVTYGAWTTGYGFFNGYLSDAKIYNRVLTPSEVMQNYGAQRNRFETNQAFATGGAVTSIVENGVRYRVHTFTSSGTLNVVYPGKMEVLVVAGGGGGGWGNPVFDGNGGGGAGGVIYNTDYSVTTGNKTVTVGAGGAGGLNVSGSRGTNGDNSVFDDITSLGGGGGGSDSGNQNGLSGGSGGGASTSGPGGVGGAGTLPQGFNGGRADQPGGGGPGGGGGGGGGASGNGQDGGQLKKGGNGGDGRQLSINGTATYYGGGGAGSSWTSSTLATGGLGGGGNGASRPGGYAATAGSTNTGGGGGAGTATQASGAGGSGIVIIRYRI